MAGNSNSVFGRSKQALLQDIGKQVARSEEVSMFLQLCRWNLRIFGDLDRQRNSPQAIHQGVESMPFSKKSSENEDIARGVLNVTMPGLEGMNHRVPATNASTEVLGPRW